MDEEEKGKDGLLRAFYEGRTGPTGRQMVWAWVILGLFTVAALYFGWFGSWLVGWPR